MATQLVLVQLLGVRVLSSEQEAARNTVAKMRTVKEIFFDWLSPVRLEA